MGMSQKPGTCKDRDILRFEPHKLIEGCLIASYAVQAHVCYIYIRGEYFIDGQKLQAAIDEAYDKKLIGKKCCWHWLGFRYLYSLWSWRIHLWRRNCFARKY